MPLNDMYLAKSSSIASRSLGDETIIMSTVDSTLFTLSPTGTLIWNSVDGKTPLSCIVEKMLKEFDVTLEQAGRDATEFVEKLVEQGLLLVSDRPLADCAKSEARTGLRVSV